MRVRCRERPARIGRGSLRLRQSGPGDDDNEKDRVDSGRGMVAGIVMPFIGAHERTERANHNAVANDSPVSIPRK